MHIFNRKINSQIIHTIEDDIEDVTENESFEIL